MPEQRVSCWLPSSHTLVANKHVKLSNTLFRGEVWAITILWSEEGWTLVWHLMRYWEMLCGFMPIFLVGVLISSGSYFLEGSLDALVAFSRATELVLGWCWCQSCRDRRVQNLERNRVHNSILLQIQRSMFVPGFALCLRLSLARRAPNALRHFGWRAKGSWLRSWVHQTLVRCWLQKVGCIAHEGWWRA